MGSTFENEDSPPWLDCFLKSFSIENPLLESSLDSTGYSNSFQQESPIASTLPPIEGFYTQEQENYGHFTSFQDCNEKWPNIIDNCSPSILDSGTFIESNSSSIPSLDIPQAPAYSSPAPSSPDYQNVPIQSIPQSNLKSKASPKASSQTKTRKCVSKKTSSSRKKLSPQSLKEKRDEQACKKIAQCRVGFSLEKKVIIPIFLALILKERKYNPSTLRWIDKSSGIFKVEDQDKIAELWATMKKKSKSCYGNFSRSIRHHHHTGYLEHDRRKLIFKFSSDFTFWK